MLSRMGAVISNGILNAAGRNSTISMTTNDGNLRQTAIVGLVLFLQHWYWYPMLNFLTLALTPTALIAVDTNLKVPKSFKLTIKSTPSTYKYPELMKKQANKEAKKVETAVLSTTDKVAARKKKRQTGEDIEMANEETEQKNEETAQKPEEEEKKEPEPKEYTVQNPCRMLRQQESKVQYLPDDEQRYHPVIESRYTGFVVLKQLRELKEGETEEFYDDEERNLDAPNPDLVSDLQIPAPFEFDPAIQNAA
jgi:26S proteasome regulatory subunit N2